MGAFKFFKTLRERMADEIAQIDLVADFSMSVHRRFADIAPSNKNFYLLYRRERLQAVFVLPLILYFTLICLETHSQEVLTLAFTFLVGILPSLTLKAVSGGASKKHPVSWLFDGKISWWS